MKRLVLLAVILLFVTGSVFAGGEGCKRENAKAVALTGTISCVGGASGEDCDRVFHVANSTTQYRVCEKSKVDFTSLSGSTVKVTGKLVTCDHGEELMIEKASKI